MVDSHCSVREQNIVNVPYQKIKSKFFLTRGLRKIKKNTRIQKCCKNVLFEDGYRTKFICKQSGRQKLSRFTK